MIEGPMERLASCLPSLALRPSARLRRQARGRGSAMSDDVVNRLLLALRKIRAHSFRGCEHDKRAHCIDWAQAHANAAIKGVERTGKCEEGLVPRWAKGDYVQVVECRECGNLIAPVNTRDCARCHDAERREEAMKRASVEAKYWMLKNYADHRLDAKMGALREQRRNLSDSLRGIADVSSSVTAVLDEINNVLATEPEEGQGS